jgi:ubiquinone/menaquinone biosynthesis C-methylase UbiE
MAKFHFVEDYERHVESLVRHYGLDEGMSLAVGGSYEQIGRLQAELLVHFGLKDGMRLADIGCGSGRTANALGQRVKIEYDGFDIVQSLLDYAASKSPPNYRYFLNRDVKLPAADESYDMICAFSLFTHLLHEETFIYLRDMLRTLKPGGTLVFSFLEFAMPAHWPIFEATVKTAENSTQPHLNMFIERNVISLIAEKLGYIDVAFTDGHKVLVPSGPLGQSIATMRKPG